VAALSQFGAELTRPRPVDAQDYLAYARLLEVGRQLIGQLRDPPRTENRRGFDLDRVHRRACTAARRGACSVAQPEHDNRG
jgi:hypothetical protein